MRIINFFVFLALLTAASVSANTGTDFTTAVETLAASINKGISINSPAISICNLLNYFYTIGLASPCDSPTVQSLVPYYTSSLAGIASNIATSAFPSLNSSTISYIIDASKCINYLTKLTHIKQCGSPAISGTASKVCGNPEYNNTGNFTKTCSQPEYNTSSLITTCKQPEYNISTYSKQCLLQEY